MGSGIEFPPDYISAEELERARPWIEGALRRDHGTHDFEDVIADVAANFATLWIFEKSALVTQTTQYPKVKVLNYWLAGGNMADLLSHEPGIVEWAKADGVTRFTIIGRKGWQRVMTPLGFSPMHHISYKDI